MGIARGDDKGGDNCDVESWVDLALGAWTGLVLDVEGTEHDILKNAYMCSTLKWIVAELHGDAARIGETVDVLTGRYFTLQEGTDVFHLVRLAPHGPHVVAAWARSIIRD